jgi:crossover junction endodeoxyribonuclease RuvC
MRRPIRILGIDPGLRRTGWGVVTIDGNRLSFLACGSLATDDKADLATRLVTIHDGLRRVVEEHAPDEYAPNLVKKTIVGAGHCEKAQIRMMIGVLLPKADPQSHDAADALAIAVTHAHHRQSSVLAAPARG